jgi:transposase
VFVRELSPQEGERLRRLSKRAKHFSARQRASILLASATRHTVPQIASLWQTDESHVRKVVHEFNERGFDSLHPDYPGGRPRWITTLVRRRIVAVAGARPDALGEPFMRWSLPKLAGYLSERGICEISPAHLGRVLSQAGLCPAHPLLEGLAGSRLRATGRPGPVALRAGSQARGGDLVRPAGAALAAPGRVSQLL